ncbi:hypothetical protein FRC00_008458, partial [Tulasnella sp. 408]
ESVGALLTTADSDSSSLWPDYASPKEKLPKPTLNDLRGRIARLSETERKADANVRYAVQPRKWAKELRMSTQGESGPGGWATLIRSRWLVVETLDDRLELWDIGSSGEEGPNNSPVATFEALSGSVDGCVVVDQAGESAELCVSTTAHQVYLFMLDLPHRCEDRKYTFGLRPHATLYGLSGLKEKQGDWWAFAKKEEANVQGFLYNPQAKAPLTRLACADAVTESQNVLDVLLRDDVTIVARNCTIDIYDKSTLAAVFESAHSDSGSSLPIVKPHHSFPARTDGSFIHHVQLLRRSPIRLKTSASTTVVYASFAESGWVVRKIDLHGSGLATITASRRVAHGISNPLLLEWGLSGSRIVALNDYALEMYFGDPRENDRDISSPGGLACRLNPNHGRALASWELPDDMEDIACFVAFDEATGIVAVGMHSGRILVADAGDSVLPPPYPEEDAKWATKHLYSRRRKPPTLHPLPPSPRRWPKMASNPGFTKPESLPDSTAQYEVAPEWFREPDRFYPSINQPDAFAGVPWLIQELAGIPADARCVLVSWRDLNEEFGEDAAIVDVADPAREGGRRLVLCAWGVHDPIEPELLDFRHEVTEETLIDSLKRGVPIRFLCEDRSLSLNRLAVGQLMVWEERRQGS